MSKALDSQRTYALIGTGGCGKTSLAEMLLFQSGVINRLGAIEEGTTTLDYEPEEIKRGVSVSATLAPVEWRDVKINFIDTPGFAAFVAPSSPDSPLSSGTRTATSSWTSPATPTLPVTFPTC